MKQAVFAVLLIGSIFSIFGCNKKRSSPKSNDMPFVLENRQIKRDLTTVYRRKADSSVIDTVRHTLTIDYPIITEWDDTEAQQIFNTRVQNLADKNVAYFEKEMVPEDYQQEVWLDSAEAETYTPIGKNTYLEVNYQLGIVSKDFIGVQFAFDAYYGGAHGVQYFEQLNFDVAAKKFLTLPDLFAPGSDYLQPISDYCRKDLLSRVEEIGSDSSMVEPGIEPKLENFENFELTSQGIKIYFTPYQVAPYASGPQEVKIPYAVLEKILRPDGVWKKIRKLGN